MKIMTIVGARPQFIKAAMVSKALRHNANSQEVLVHTGQHYDAEMSDLFFKELDIQEPDYNLGIGSASHPKQIAKMLEALEPVLKKETPDWIIVYGDTNTTFAGALIASQLRIPVAHIEAGLRSFNREMPEERNRVLVDHLADLMFVPSEDAIRNLENEGITGDNVQLVGDVMYDAALYYGKKVDMDKNLVRELKLSSKNYSLASVHRAENTDVQERLVAIFESLMKISSIEPVVVPLHPRTRQKLKQLNMLDSVSKCLILLPPIGYLDMIALTKHASVVLTDSGGLQKEAYFFRVPCLTLRDETEWVELLELGVNRLVGADVNAIMAGFQTRNKEIMIDKNPYGDGDAAQKIAKHLLSLG